MADDTIKKCEVCESTDNMNSFRGMLLCIHCMRTYRFMDAKIIHRKSEVTNRS